MKKVIALLIIFSVIATSTICFAAADSIVINGENAVIPPQMGTVREISDRTFVPVRFVTEYLGCVVNYSDKDVSATITDKNGHISYYVISGNQMLYVLPDPEYGKGRVIEMDVPPFVDDTEGRMYIPVRFLAEAMGYSVEWDEATQTVIMNAAA